MEIIVQPVQQLRKFPVEPALHGRDRFETAFEFCQYAGIDTIELIEYPVHWFSRL
jgi:hypothetical protein